MNGAKIGKQMVREGVKMMQEGVRAMGKNKKVVTRGRKQEPIESKLKLSFEWQEAEELGGTLVSGSMTVPIRKHAFDRLSRLKKEDAAAALRQLADAVEKGGLSSIDPTFYVAMAGGIEAMKATKNGKGRVAN